MTNMAKTVPPQLGLDSFSCPYCGAIAHQTWYKLLLANYKSGERPSVLVYTDDGEVAVRAIHDDEERARLQQVLAQLKKQVIGFHSHEISSHSNFEMFNLHMSRCYSCAK